MSDITFLLPLLLISHVLGDGLFGSRELAARKRSQKWSRQLAAIASHTAPHAVLAGALMFLVDAAWIKAAVLVCALHFVIDFSRCKADTALFGPGGLGFHQSLAYLTGRRDDAANPGKKTLRKWLAINLADQTAHVASLLLIAAVL